MLVGLVGWGGGEKERLSMFTPSPNPILLQTHLWPPAGCTLPFPCCSFQSTALCMTCVWAGGWKDRKREKNHKWDEGAVEREKRDKGRMRQTSRKEKKCLGCQVWSTPGERQRLESVHAQTTALRNQDKRRPAVNNYTINFQPGFHLLISLSLLIFLIFCFLVFSFLHSTSCCCTLCAVW